MDPAPQPQPGGDGGAPEPPQPPASERPEPPPAPEEQPRPPWRERLRRLRRRHPRGVVVALALLVLVVAAGLLLAWYLHTHESTDDAQIDGHIAALSARVAGTVTAVYVEDNAPVRRGQLLVQLDPRDYEVALARAEAELEQARANLAAERPSAPMTETTTRTQLATSRDEVATARAAIAAPERDRQAALARLRAAEATDTRAQADRARAQFLLAQRAITRERYDQAVATADAAHAEVASSRALARAAAKTVDEQRARLQEALSRQGEVAENAPHQLSIREATIAARRAAVRAAEAAVERAQLDLAYTRIVAPGDGVVGRRSVEPGQRVQPGEQLLAVVDLAALWVTANFKETQWRRLRVGQPVRIKVDALATTLDGTVESFAGASGARYSLLPPENATGNYVKVVQRLPVRIGLDAHADPQHRLRPGMSVEPTVRIR